MRWLNWRNIFTKSCSSFASVGTKFIFLYSKILWRARRAFNVIVEVAGAKKKIKNCSDLNVNTFFIPFPKMLVHIVLKELLITFTTRSRMTNENFRPCGSLPLFLRFTPHVFPLIVTQLDHQWLNSTCNISE